MLDAVGFLDSFVEDEVKCRMVSEMDFGQPLDNEKNDVPLYDNQNKGLAVCEQGMERKNLGTEPQGRPGLTGYIPSMEEGLEAGAAPKPKMMLMDLGGPSEEMLEQSRKRRGLSR
jgi:hypothetical protein